MKVLVFGGNGCIGSCVVELLLKNGVELTLLNRGNWRWNTAETIKPYVKWVYCDRQCPQAFVWTELEKDAPYAAVLDFSALSTFCIRPFYRRLKALSRHYIYISTSSVYEICQVDRRQVDCREESGVRPEDLEIRLGLARRNSYADGKLLAEEFLMEERQLDGMWFTIVRLPDVLAERDSTNRFWLLQIWLLASRLVGKAVLVPRGSLDLSSSYVYVGDVAACILSILNEPTRCLDHVYNFSSYPSVTLRQLLSLMLQTLGLHEPLNVVEVDDEEEAPLIFPSSTCGPVDCSRIQSRYAIGTTELTVCLANLCAFYKRAAAVYPEQLESVLGDICEICNLSTDAMTKLREALLADSKRP